MSDVPGYIHGYTDEEAQRLLGRIHQEKLRLFFAHIPARFGVINPDSADPPSVASDG